MPFKPVIKMARCPFNSEHVITSDRLQKHIIKCALNYPNHYTCPFFAMHKFLNKEEYDAHLLTCDKKMPLYPGQEEKQTGRIMPTVIHFNIPKSNDDEDWTSEY